MRWIFRYDDTAKKYISKILKKKLPNSEPWLHVAVKTVSERNPWSGIAIYVWDTRQVIFEYRQNTGSGSAFTKDQFKMDVCGMHRALDNRKPLVGGRKDINEFFEFGNYDASHSDVFDADGKRVTNTDLYKRRAAKRGTEAFEIVTESYSPDFKRFEIATEALDLKPGQKVKVQKFNLGVTNGGDKLLPETPKVGKIDKIATFGEVIDGKMFKRPDNAMELNGTRRNTTLYLIDGIWYKPHKNKYGACIITPIK